MDNSKIFINGLTQEEVKQQINAGHVNVDNDAKTKSISEIIRSNVCTLFNLINFILAVLLIYAGSYKNLMFMVVVIVNFVIGIFQEIRAKIMVDKLSLISAQNVYVLRDSKIKKVQTDEIVLGDVVCYASGDQVASDGKIIEGACEVNESLLTGEPNSIRKTVKDKVLSGSYLVSGSCKVLVTSVGKDNYSSKVLNGIKTIERTESEIMRTTKKIIKFISFAIIPVSILLFYKQFSVYNFDLKNLIVGVSGAIIGMIPEGLVLLISSVLAVSVVRLSKRKVLVQDIYCIETLARADTICFDKTGTLTEGSFEIDGIVPFEKDKSQEFLDKLTMLIQGLNDTGETFEALNKKFNPDNKKISVEKAVLFSSEKKFSGASFKSYGTYVIGAPEVVFKNNLQLIQEKLCKYTNNYRVLIFAHSANSFGKNDTLPDNLNPIGFILIKDKIRHGTKKIIDFFYQQNLEIKIISGDNAETIKKIAKDLNISKCEKFKNLTELKSNKEIYEIADKYTIFGRATPEQKQLLIKALKSKNHVTAMIGDGVNDVLALKEADCSISFANGSDAARNISHVVLMNSNFNSVPKIVMEGRRSINNIQRSAALFLTKTIYSVILAVLFVFINVPYPFIPIQMSLMSAFTIGIPSFFLALEANKDRIKGNLFKNILRFSLPGSIVIIFDILICILFYKILKFDEFTYSTIALFLVSYVSFLVLHKISLPLTLTRKILFYVLATGFIFTVFSFMQFFSIKKLNFLEYVITVTLIYCSHVLFQKMPEFLHKIYKKYRRFFRINVF